MSVEKEIGTILRQARESIGLSLDELQEKTNIQRPFLEAIEEGDFEKLPSPFYVRTYLRNYANHVKIEPHHILREYRKVEQAKRGLTGVHKAVSEKTLAEQLRVHTAGRIPMNHQKTQVHKKPASRTRRTNAHTALTIANKKSGANRRQAATPSARTGYTAMQQQAMQKQQQQDLSQSTRRHTRVTDYTTTVKRPRSTQTKPNKMVAKTSKPASQETTIRRPEKKERQSRIKSDVYQSLSRTRRHKKVTNTIPPTSAKKEEPKEPSRHVTQSVTKINRLSRRSAYNQAEREKKAKKGLGKRTTALIIAGVILCIPLLWISVKAIADSGSEKPPATEETAPNTTTDNQETTPPPTSEQSDTQSSSEDDGKSSVSLVSNNGESAEYEVTGSGQSKIVISASNESWVQIRKQQAVQKTGFLKDSILKPGNSLQYTHDFSQEPEIWITLAVPSAVQITVDGNPIKSVRTLHIKQK